jgi:hypothetical protein
MSTYKRPIVRPRISSGVSTTCQRISPTASGRVADICRSSQAPVQFSRPVWTPPRDHTSYFAALQARGENTEKFERMTEEFYLKYPKSVKTAEEDLGSKYNYEPMLELTERYYSKGQQPPVIVVVRAMRKAGYSEERIDKFTKWHKRMEDTYQARTEALDKIFARWPSASKGPVKKKVIKAVKKNI